MHEMEPASLSTVERMTLHALNDLCLSRMLRCWLLQKVLLLNNFIFRDFKERSSFLVEFQGHFLLAACFVNGFYLSCKGWLRSSWLLVLLQSRSKSVNSTDAW